MMKNRIFQCSNPSCSFRFPANAALPAPAWCPRCGSGNPLVNIEYAPARVDISDPDLRGVSIEAVLDNIRSGFNVGSMFRSADGAGVNRLHLCGITPTPDNPAVAKTALGAEQAVPWIYFEKTDDAGKALVQRGYRLWALEGGHGALPVFEVLDEIAAGETRIALVCGNEVSGIDPNVLNLCEKRIALPMSGVKDSLNVAVAFGIAIYILASAKRLAPRKTWTTTA